MLKLKPRESATIIFPPLVDQRQALIYNFQFSIFNFQIIDCSLLPELTLAAFKEELNKLLTLDFACPPNPRRRRELLTFVHADVLFPLGPPPFLYLQSLIKHLPAHSPVSIITLIAQNILSERLRKRLLAIPFLFENIHYVPLEKTNLPFTNKQQAKNFFLLLNDNQRRILRLLVRGTEKIPSHIMPDQEYLDKLNIIRRHYGRWKLVSPLLERAALEVTEGLNESLQLKNGRILIGQQNITDQFSPQQKKVMLTMLEAKGKTVSRERLARTLWGPAYAERYSDWAIDQLIFSLRRKLARLWINPASIVAKKKQGFQLNRAGGLLFY